MRRDEEREKRDSMRILVKWNIWQFCMVIFINIYWVPSALWITIIFLGILLNMSVFSAHFYINKQISTKKERVKRGKQGRRLKAQPLWSRSIGHRQLGSYRKSENWCYSVKPANSWNWLCWLLVCILNEYNTSTKAQHQLFQIDSIKHHYRYSFPYAIQPLRLERIHAWFTS